MILSIVSSEIFDEKSGETSIQKLLNDTSLIDYCEPLPKNSTFKEFVKEHILVEDLQVNEFIN